ncbi:copia protein [Tanacetum coccineum]
MERGFLSEKRSGGRGVKEKNENVSNIEAVKENDLNDEPVAMEVQGPLVYHTNAAKRVGKPTFTYTGNYSSWNHPCKRVAYPVVANYVRNTWGKFSLVKSMLNSSTGLFSFQFSSMDGLNSMLENGPWFIRNHPLILRKWNPDVDLLKEDVGNVPVWVKLYGVVYGLARMVFEGIAQN